MTTHPSFNGKFFNKISLVSEKIYLVEFIFQKKILKGGVALFGFSKKNFFTRDQVARYAQALHSHLISVGAWRR
jgi:hypothetical protein